MTTIRNAFFEVARRLGMTTIFGNPGSTEETLLREFPSDFRYVLALQEAPAVAMADGYAQRTGRPALVNLHTAAGMGNALGNIESAWFNRTPLVITAGQQTREMLLIEPYLTNTKPHLIAEPFVKWSCEPSRPEDVPAALLRAYATAVQAPAGPVFLSMPMDDLDKPCAALPAHRTLEPRLGADLTLLRPVVEALDGARAPGLVIGGAVDRSGGWADAIRLAERLRAKVWAAPLEGRPGFPETHALFQGSLPGAIGPLGRELAGCDVVVVIGAPVFRYYPFIPGDYLPAGTRLFHLTDDVTEAARAPVGDSFLVDAGRACTALADAVAASERLAPSGRPRLPVAEPGPVITPDYLYQCIDDVRPADAIIVQESLSTMGALRRRIPTARPGAFYSMSSGVLGFGLAAAVGVALAEQEAGTRAKVIGIIGDGSANYVIQALWSAAQHQLDILFVVPRNGAYMILKSFADLLATPGVPGLDLPGLDFVALARGYGLTGERVEDAAALRDVLRSAIDRRGPYVVEVAVDTHVPPLL